MTVNPHFKKYYLFPPTDFLRHKLLREFPDAILQRRMGYLLLGGTQILSESWFTIPGLFVGSDPLPIEVGRSLLMRGLRIAVAESCTGGLLSYLLTQVPNASRYFWQGFIPYRAEAKVSTMGLSPDSIRRQGSISRTVAIGLARSARTLSGVEIGLGLTGLAGPSGGSQQTPIGTVFVAIRTPNGNTSRRLVLNGSRQSIRHQAALWALLLLYQMLRRF
jgi:nicotinamide-nucleotide amidase